MTTWTEQQLAVIGTAVPAAARAAVRERIGELLPTTPLPVQGTGAPFAGSSAWGPPD